MSDALNEAFASSVSRMLAMTDAPAPPMSKDDKRRMLTEKMPPERVALAEAAREEFISVWQEKVIPARGEQATKLLHYLDSESCDFFVTPASARGHGAHFGGLVMHSLNVYNCLVDVLSSQIYRIVGLEPSEDTIAVVALLHDLCKVNFYSVESRNRKRPDGQWEAYPFISYNDSFPYGHGEKSVYMASRFIDLSAEETMAIRYHMGFSDCADANQRRHFSDSARKYPLCVALNEADTRAAILLEGYAVDQMHKGQAQG